MVQLEFEVNVQAPFHQVWKYFSVFQNLPDWDPNTKKCQVVKKTEKQVGSVYNILTVFNEKQSTVVYETTKFEQTNQRGYISLYGKNDNITALDEISCTKKGENKTLITYRAEISLRGVLWLFTPFIRGGLNNITAQAKAGCIKKSIQRWGKAQ